MAVGDYIRKKRKEKKVTLQELGEKINLSHSYLSQIEKGDRKASFDTIRNISEILDIDFYELASMAGYYTPQEVDYVKQRKEFFASMTPEEYNAYQLENLKSSKRYENIMKFQENRYVRLEDFLHDDRRSFYIDDHKLSKDDIKMLISLYGGKEKNYPSDKQIENEYEEIKNSNEEIKKIVKKDKNLIITNDDYDIDTNEEIK